ncbi:TPA: hypothetical protein ACOP6K_001137 [Streptococcus pneumoniae]|nr:Uncharacterised protein [Streptococcus pneumoniae]VKR69459.1 Uncharacterised protein [Streptococcus pneumoniae]VKR88359.1 Uncharacterised protein [Streptococcus pneumoniae]VKX53506.1 Uncharacterised protein [Streptococcus pneumoniae]VMT64065.1 Uncharacterised protein [Streptococcus pneumoniae]
MNRNVLEFLKTETAEKISLFIRKINGLEGNVTLLSINSQDLEDIKNAMLSNSNLGLKIARLDVMKKIAYASNFTHYKYGTTIMDDISSGKIHRRPKSYI